MLMVLNPHRRTSSARTDAHCRKPGNARPPIHAIYVIYIYPTTTPPNVPIRSPCGISGMRLDIHPLPNSTPMSPQLLPANFTIPHLIPLRLSNRSRVESSTKNLTVAGRGSTLRMWPFYSSCFFTAAVPWDRRPPYLGTYIGRSAMSRGQDSAA